MQLRAPGPSPELSTSHQGPAFALSKDFWGPLGPRSHSPQLCRGLGQDFAGSSSPVQQNSHKVGIQTARKSPATQTGKIWQLSYLALTTPGLLNDAN